MEWEEHIARLKASGEEIAAWPAAEPRPEALRCEFSRHRTLAHLRAAQETWLQGAILFAAKDGASLNLPHPWRLFTDRNYELVSWDEHLNRFLADRETWLELVRRPDLDRNRGGKLSRKPRTIASLTEVLISHERHHIEVLRERP